MTVRSNAGIVNLIHWRDVTLGQDFHEDLRAELAAIALAAVAPLADSESHGRFLEKGLRDAADKLGALLAASTIDQPQRRRALQTAHGIALLAIGERESGTEGLQQAVVAFRATLEETTREREPLVWAKTHNHLGTALRVLGERELDTERLQQAVAAFSAALEVRTRESLPLEWAATQNNLGNALQMLGEREAGTQRPRTGCGGVPVGARREFLRARTVPLGHNSEQSRHYPCQRWRAGI